MERMHVERFLPPYTCTMQNTLRDFIELPCAQRAHGRGPFPNNDKRECTLDSADFNASFVSFFFDYQQRQGLGFTGNPHLRGDL